MESKSANDLNVQKQSVEKKTAPTDFRKAFGRKRVIIPAYLVTLLIIFFVLKGIFNVVITSFDMIFNRIGDGNFEQLKTDLLNQISSKEMILGGTQGSFILFIVFSITALWMLSKFYKLYVRYRPIAFDQHGSARFTTQKELEQQYKAIPQIAENYKGESGFPISHFKKVYYICIDTFNTLIIGTSRSGKGVTSVVPSMDIDSRAEEKPSIIVGDPKGELAGASYETLRKRGYDVEILNIENPGNGMSYNPLYLITKYYKRGDLDTAQKYTKSLGHTLFYDPKVQDSSWNDYASSTTQALILTLVDYCIKNNEEEKITLRNVYNMLLSLGTDTEVDEKSKKEVSKLDRYMDMLREQNPSHPAVIAYGTASFSQGKMRASIFAQVSKKLDDINKDAIAKMMSRNTIDFKRVGFNKYIELKFNPNKRIKKGSVIIKEEAYSFTVDANGFAEVNFNKKLETNDEVILEVEYGSVREKMTIGTKREAAKMITGLPKIDEYSGEVVMKKYLKLDIPTNDYLENIRIHYSEKPIAIFMVVPDYDSSEHFIASLFISQLYTELARECGKTKGMSCFTRVKFRLDEFGNLPPSMDMASILTVCLGRNILFELYIQEFKQIETSYSKDEASTIIANCQNKVYIKSTDEETPEMISKLAGEKTVESVNRSAGSYSTDVNESRSVEKKRLITADELRDFVMGETLVLRPLKTRDLNNKNVRPYPILNIGDHQMPKSFETISEWFNTKNELSKYNIPSKHRNLDLVLNNVDLKHMQASKGGYALKSYVSEHKNKRIYMMFKGHAKSELEIDDIEFISLVNQETQKAFYDYLERICKRKELDFEEEKDRINLILSSHPDPIEERFEKKNKTEQLRLMDREFLGDEHYQTIKVYIEQSELKQSDKDTLNNEATVGMARDIIRDKSILQLLDRITEDYEKRGED